MDIEDMEARVELIDSNSDRVLDARGIVLNKVSYLR